MKKVRYIIGTAGVLGAAPALGLLTPAAAAVHATPAQHSGKTVSLRPGTVLAATSRASGAATSSGATSAAESPASAAVPAATCAAANAHNSGHKGTGVNKFTGRAYYRSSTHCLSKTYGQLSHQQTGLDMRTYAYNGTKEVYNHYVSGSIPFFRNYTFWSDYPGVIATKVCEALVYSTDKARVAYGPVCENVL